MSAIREEIRLGIAQATVGDTTLSISGPLKLSLHTADPGFSGAPTNEVTGGSYARQTITFGAPTTDAPGRKINNNNQIEFAGMPAATITHWYVWSSLGVALFRGTISASVGAGQSLIVEIGDIKLHVEGLQSTFWMDAVLDALRAATEVDYTSDTIYLSLCSADPGQGAVTNLLPGITPLDAKAALDTVQSVYHWTNGNVLTHPQISPATPAYWVIYNASLSNQVLLRTNIGGSEHTDFRWRPYKPDLYAA